MFNYRPSSSSPSSTESPLRDRRSARNRASEEASSWAWTTRADTRTTSCERGRGDVAGPQSGRTNGRIRVLKPITDYAINGGSDARKRTLSPAEAGHGPGRQSKKLKHRGQHSEASKADDVDIEVSSALAATVIERQRRTPELQSPSSDDENDDGESSHCQEREQEQGQEQEHERGQDKDEEASEEEGSTILVARRVAYKAPEVLPMDAMVEFEPSKRDDTQLRSQWNDLQRIRYDIRWIGVYAEGRELYKTKGKFDTAVSRYDPLWTRNYTDGERMYQAPKVDLDHDAVKRVVCQCSRTMAAFSKGGEEFAREIQHTERLVEDLYPHDDICQPVDDDGCNAACNDDRTRSIACAYTHLFPALVILVVHTAELYVRDDKEASIQQYKVLVRLIQIVLDLFVQVQRYESPSPLLHVFWPVKEGLVQPLYAVQKVFAAYIHKYDATQIRNLNTAARRADKSISREREERATRRREAMKGLRQRWTALHVKRMTAITVCVPRRVLDHFEMPDEGPTPEGDDNGVPIDDGEQLAWIIGPPSHLVELARLRYKKWTPSEVAALKEALKVHAGPLVFFDIFRELCDQGAALYAYNVTEIVTAAAILKASTIDRCRRRSSRMPAWAMTIPDWTQSAGDLIREQLVSMGYD